MRDDPLRALDLPGDLARRPPQQARMGISMVADLVPFFGDAARGFGEAFDVLAAEEKRGADGRLLEHVEDEWSRLARPVIKRQRDFAGVSRAVLCQGFGRR